VFCLSVWNEWLHGCSPGRDHGDGNGVAGLRVWWIFDILVNWNVTCLSECHQYNRSISHCDSVPQGLRTIESSSSTLEIKTEVIGSLKRRTNIEG
jgi:hypothetical protein